MYVYVVTQCDIDIVINVLSSVGDWSIYEYFPVSYSDTVDVAEKEPGGVVVLLQYFLEFETSLFD